jgi:hypothetical protein
MALTVAPLFGLTRKGIIWNWTNLEQTTFLKVKQLVAQVQALTVIREGEPFELDITVEPKRIWLGSMATTRWYMSAYWFLVSIMERS